MTAPSQSKDCKFSKEVFETDLLRDLLTGRAFSKDGAISVVSSNRLETASGAEILHEPPVSSTTQNAKLGMYSKSWKLVTKLQNTVIQQNLSRPTRMKR